MENRIFHILDVKVLFPGNEMIGMNIVFGEEKFLEEYLIELRKLYPDSSLVTTQSFQVPEEHLSYYLEKLGKNTTTMH